MWRYHSETQGGITCQASKLFDRSLMFTKYIVVVDDDVDVHNTREVLFTLA